MTVKKRGLVPKLDPHPRHTHTFPLGMLKPHPHLFHTCLASSMRPATSSVSAIAKYSSTHAGRALVARCSTATAADGPAPPPSECHCAYSSHTLGQSVDGVWEEGVGGGGITPWCGSIVATSQQRQKENISP